jgi:hypothetical protein
MFFFLLFPLIIILSLGLSSVVHCEGSDFPNIAEVIGSPVEIIFTDLHIVENLNAAKKALQGLTGIYGIQCVITGAIYIGSAVDINDRFLEHLVYENLINISKLRLLCMVFRILLLM